MLAAPWHPRELGTAGASGAGRAGQGRASQSLSHCSSQRAGQAGQPGWAISSWMRARLRSGEGSQVQGQAQDEARSGIQSMGYSLNEWASWPDTHVALGEEG